MKGLFGKRFEFYYRVSFYFLKGGLACDQKIYGENGLT